MENSQQKWVKLMELVPKPIVKALSCERFSFNKPHKIVLCERASDLKYSVIFRWLDEQKVESQLRLLDTKKSIRGYGRIRWVFERFNKDQCFGGVREFYITFTSDGAVWDELFGDVPEELNGVTLDLSNLHTLKPLTKPKFRYYVRYDKKGNKRTDLCFQESWTPYI